MKRNAQQQEEIETEDGIWVRITKTFVVENDKKIESGEPNLEFRTPTGGYTKDFTVEQIERIAAIATNYRHEAHTYDSVCPAHGYYEDTECPACQPPQMSLPQKEPKKKSVIADLMNPKKSTGGDTYGEF